jgi:hypothetical protein
VPVEKEQRSFGEQFNSGVTKPSEFLGIYRNSTIDQPIRLNQQIPVDK